MQCMRDPSGIFTTRGRIVTPAEFRRKHGIKAGTKVKLTENEFGGIVIVPVTDRSVRRTSVK